MDMKESENVTEAPEDRQTQGRMSTPISFVAESNHTGLQASNLTHRISVWRQNTHVCRSIQIVTVGGTYK